VIFRYDYYCGGPLAKLRVRKKQEEMTPMSTSTPSTGTKTEVTEKRIVVAVTVNRVDRTRDPQQALDATGRRQYTDSDVVATMPSGGTGVSENVTVEFFRLGKYVSDDELAKAYEERGLVPNPYAQAAVNEADPEFADEYPNGTHWKDEDDKWCFVAFNRRDVGRDVYVDRYDYVWNDYWWFGGVRK